METNLKQLLANNPNPVLSVGKNGTVHYSNVAGELLLQEWSVGVGGKLPSYIVDLVQRVTAQNSSKKMEVKVGKRVYLIEFHSLLEDECVYIYGLDISDRKELEEKLQESEKRFSEAQRLTHIGNWDWNIVANKMYRSDEMYHILGLNSYFDTNFGLFLRRLHPEDRVKLDNALIDTLNGKPFDNNYRILLSDGEERIVHIIGEVIFDENNNPIRVRGIVQDVTELKRSEEKLRESEEKYRNIVETALEGIFIVNAENKIIYANKRTAELLGYTLGEIIGRSAWNFISEESKPVAERSLEKRRQKINESYELKLIRKDGSLLWIFTNAKPLFNKDGEYTGTLSMMTDITKRKETEEALVNLEIARQKEVHHRIKNNLQVISSLLDLQAEQFKNKECMKDSEVLEAFRESQNRVISMALIHEELHKGERIEKLNFSSYVKELAENLLLTYRLGNSDINLNMELDQNVFFDMDTAVPLGIIINELVSNSLKHAFPDRNYGEIRIKLHREEGSNTSFILIVSDNGMGIPKDLNIEDINSLGLQLVTTLIDQLDGQLELKRDNGTEFTIKFTVEEENKASVPIA
jgi:PAS domain S-box-containing protein